MAKELRRLGMLTVLERPLLASYCMLWSRCVRAERVLLSEGEFYESQTQDGRKMLRKHPMVEVLNESLRQLRLYATELGLSAPSRTRFEIIATETEAEALARERFGF